MKYLNKIMLTSLAVIALSSCNDDENANTNYTSTVKPIVSVIDQSATTVTEGEYVTITLESNTSYKEAMDFKLELVSGGEDADYFAGDLDGNEVGVTTLDSGFGSFGYKIEMPAYATTTTFIIYIQKDVLMEGTNELRFRLSSADNKNGMLANGDKEYIDISVTDYSSESLALIANWETDVTYKTLSRFVLGTDADDVESSHTESLCDLGDVDIFLNTYDAFAFTGACPEEASEHTADGANVDTSVLADGSYDIITDMWVFDLGLEVDDNEELVGAFNIPMTIQVGKTGGFMTSFTVPAAYDTTLTDSDTTGGAGERTVGQIVVLGGKYTVYDHNGDLVAAE
jgi:hypothetical protein